MEQNYYTSSEIEIISISEHDSFVKRNKRILLLLLYRNKKTLAKQRREKKSNTKNAIMSLTVTSGV